jgi:hypothetical protein
LLEVVARGGLGNLAAAADLGEELGADLLCRHMHATIIKSEEQEQKLNGITKKQNQKPKTRK